MKRYKIALLLIVFLLIAVVLVACWIFESKYSNKFFPGIYINGKSVEGLTYKEVLLDFTNKAEALSKDGLTLTFNKNGGQKEINIPKTITGFTSDVTVDYFSIGEIEKNISLAYDWGRKGDILNKIKEQFALIYGKSYNLPVTAHKEAILSLLTRETKNFFKDGVPAYFSFDANGKPVIIPEKLGDNVNIESIINTISEKFNLFETQPIVFDIGSKAPFPTKEKLEPFISLAEEFSNSASVNFYYQNRKWPVGGKTLATWLTLKSDYEMTIDNKKLRIFLASSITPLIDNPPQNSRFEMRDGNLVEISPGKSGNAVNIDKVVELINTIVPQIKISYVATSIDVPIEIVEVKPEVTQETIDKYQIKDLIGTATTNFTGGSKDRQHNIEVGVSKLTGILIAPGEDFSTVKNIGEVSEEAGFVKEYVIRGNQTIKELGGGLCQLATTLFRTALDAGFPITERINHRYVISYYGPGLDATIYDPKPDFRFVNDTENYVLLQGKAKNDEVIFELYGVSDGRKVEIGEPVLSNPKPVPETRIILSSELAVGQMRCETVTHKGITADTTYKVTYADGTVKENIFHSVYEPWPKVCLVGI